MPLVNPQQSGWSLCICWPSTLLNSIGDALPLPSSCLLPPSSLPSSPSLFPFFFSPGIIDQQWGPHLRLCLWETEMSPTLSQVNTCSADRAQLGSRSRMPKVLCYRYKSFSWETLFHVKKSLLKKCVKATNENDSKELIFFIHNTHCSPNYMNIAQDLFILNFTMSILKFKTSSLKENVSNYQSVY